MARREEADDKQRSGGGCQGRQESKHRDVCPLPQEAKERTQLQKQGALMGVSLKPSC